MSINPFPMWIVPKSMVYLICLVMVMGFFFLLGFKKELVINKYNITLFFVLMLFLLFMTLPLFGRQFDWPPLLRFSSFPLLLFFPNRIHYLIYTYFRKLIIFTSGFAIIIFFLLLVGIELPYYKVDGFTEPMQFGDHFYRIYGVVVSSTNTVYEISGLSIARACGPFLEPGHFAIYIGIVLSIERVLYGKISKLPLIAGFLTFSPAFVAILFFIMVYDIVFRKNFKLLFLVSTFVFLLFGVIIANETMRNAIYYIAIGRNFSSVEDVTLDHRTSQRVLSAYNRFVHSDDFYTGMGVDWVNEKYGILSDFRGFIFRLGLIGFLLSILLLSVIFYGGRKKLLFLLIPIAILIHAHRFWMFTAPYIYLLMLLGKNSSTYWRFVGHNYLKKSKRPFRILFLRK